MLRKNKSMFVGNNDIAPPGKEYNVYNIIIKIII